MSEFSDDSNPGVAPAHQAWPQILEEMPGGVVELRRDGHIVHANTQALAIMGLSRAEVSGRFANDFEAATIRPDGAPFPASEYPSTKAMLTGATSGPIRMGFRRADGEVRWLSVFGNPVRSEAGEITGAFVTFVDVTEQQRTEAALRRSEAHLRTILETAPEIILSTDPAGIITFSNRTVPELEASNLIGLDIRQFVTEATRPALEAAIEHAVGHREKVRYEADDPYGRPFEAVVAPVIEAGEVVSLTFICVDVSESRQLRAQLTISDRMASVGTLAVGVAHEINNPLTYVLANLQRLQRKFREGEASGLRDAGEVSRSVEQIMEGAERIRRVVRDLGDFAGRRSASAVSSNVHDVVATTLRLASHETRFRAEVVTEGDPALFVCAEPSRLGQALLNLVVNAAHAIPEGRAEENKIRVTWASRDGGDVEISVADTGAGMGQATVARIFEPFFTTKAPGVGTGLGLYILRNIMTTLGGSIEVESVEGRGSTFRIVLPSASRRASTSIPPADEAALAPARRGRILIVDDEELIRRVIANVFAEHEVVSCAGGDDALEALRSGRFDVILCDLIMPKVTGMDLYEAVQRELPDLCERFIFISGGAFTERSQAFRRTVPNTVLNKPFDMEALRDLVQGRIQAVHGD